VIDATDGRHYSLNDWSRGTPSVRTRRITDGLMVRSDRRKWAYCLEYGPMRASAAGIHRFTLDYDLRSGAIAFGVLSGNRKRWLASAKQGGPASEGRTITATVYLRRGSVFWLVISNDHPAGGVASRFVVRRLTGAIEKRRWRPELMGALRRSGLAFRRSALKSWDRATKPRPSRPRKRVLERGVLRTLVDMLRSRLHRRPMHETPEYRQLNEQYGAAVARLERLSPLAELDHLHTLLQERRPDQIHTNGCGDFQLMSRDHWLELRGYPELEVFSMNVDGLFGSIAHYAGIREVVLESPRHIYHLEHERGSGWTPEGEALLRRRIAERGVPWLNAKDVFVWSAYMHWLRRPMNFNGSDWGFGASNLTETVIEKTPRSD